MDDLGSSTPESQRAASDGVADHLTQHLSSLTDVLQSVDDDPRLMDASLEDVHEIAARVAKVVKRQVFNNPDLSVNVSYWDIYDIFDLARANESDHYEGLRRRPGTLSAEAVQGSHCSRFGQR